MRRRRTAALLPALVLLAGCAGGPDMTAGGPGLTGRAPGGTAGRLDVTVGGLDMTVAGPFGARPTIAFTGGRPAAGLQVDEPAIGDGPPLAADDVAIVQYTAHVWDGKDNRLVDSSFDRGTPAAFPAGEGLGGALRGHRVGSRVVAAVPRGPGAGQELLYVVDILGSHPRGASVEAGGGTLAGVRVTGGAPPALEVPATAPPAAFAVKVLARGDGRATQAGQLVVAQYEGVVWSRGRVFDTTWTTGRPKAFRIGDGSVIKGWDRALVGVPAGSRVLMIVPPSYGYGAAGDPAHGITGSDTLVFVVDVLAAY
ncbi:FKBP-type peptidyl-prolyl cis-trans isomerase [Nonomuraea sp. CA-141351]|uniref:FKBP-type peptidyl-prolyl cis-trans isomerase n=1 Tax=Nonomuraea sp. CA-141351 TaxID=3239996 RepID=UPI003D9374B0